MRIKNKKSQELFSFLERNRDFRFLWSSQGLSQISLNFINFVMAIRIYEKTGSTLAVSFLWIFYYLPSFFLGPFSGFFVDLWSRRKILLYTNLLQSMTVFMLLFAHERVYFIYAIVFLYSLLNLFYNPAEAASIPWLVKKPDLSFANSLFLLTSQTSLIFGLGASGILMRLFGKDNPIWIAAVSLFLAAVVVYFLPHDQPDHQNWTKSFSQFFGKIKAGYSFIKNKRIILFPIIFLASFQVFVVVLGVTIPSFSTEILKIEMQDSGPLLIVPLGLGALTGTFFMTKLSEKIRKKTLIKNGLGVIFVILLFFSLLLSRFGSYKAIVAIPLMYFVGTSGFFCVIPSLTLVQENTPSFLRGRVYGTLSFFSNMITLPFLLFTASLVDLLGVRTFVFLISLFVLLALVLFDKVEEYILSKP